MRKVRHKTLEFEKNTQEVSTAKNQDTSRKSGDKEKKIRQKRRIHPNVKNKVTVTTMRKNPPVMSNVKNKVTVTTIRKNPPVMSRKKREKRSKLILHQDLIKTQMQKQKLRILP